MGMVAQLLTSQGCCEEWMGSAQGITSKGSSLEYIRKDQMNSCPLALPWWVSLGKDLFSWCWAWQDTAPADDGGDPTT